MQSTGNLYADLSAYYDQFCAEVDYAGQCAFTARVFDAFAGSDGREYLDLACGTGQHLQRMEQLGFAATGLDNSADMLARAQLRCPSANLLLCDLAGFDQVEAFDLISCFLYSIHYSYPLANFIETLRRAHRALKPGGVFVFNTVDARGAVRENAVVTRVTEGDALLTFRSGWYYDEVRCAGSSGVLDLRLMISRESGAVRQSWSDHHTMTAVTLPALQALLAEAGFDFTLLEHDYERLTPWNGQSFNAIVVACKARVRGHTVS